MKHPLGSFACALAALSCWGCLYDVGALNERRVDAAQLSSADPVVVPALSRRAAEPGQVTGGTIDAGAVSPGDSGAGVVSPLDAGSSDVDAFAPEPLPPRCLDPELVPRVFVAAQTGPYAVEVSGNEVVWLDRNLVAPQQGTVKIRKESGGPITVLAADQHNPTDLTVDGVHVYWTESGAGKLWRVPRDASAAPTEIKSGQGNPRGIEQDDEAIYWSSYNGDLIRSLNKADIGTDVPATVLASGFDRPLLITLDGDDLYFTTERGIVARVPKDGSEPPLVLVTAEQLVALLGDEALTFVAAYGVAVHADYVYFRARALRDAPVRDGLGTLMRVNKDGTGLESLFDDRRSGFAFLVQSQGSVYVAVPGLAGAVHRLDTSDLSVESLNCQLEPSPVGLALSNNWVYWANSRGATLMRARR